MESDTIDNNSESKFPLIAGIAGIALGVIALILAVKAKNAADAASIASLAASQSAGEASAAVASKADGAAVQGLVADYTAFKTKTEGAFNEAAVAYNKLTLLVSNGSGSRSSGGAGAVAGPGEYIVVKGDTLSGIARKNGISLKAIQDLNPGVGAALRIGQKVRVK